MQQDLEKYKLDSWNVKTIISLIEANEIAIPEIQRPFVWKKTQVRDLLDSLYKGYPTGYLIVWKNPNVKMKDGKMSSGRKILIDGQQRVTALMAAISGRQIINDQYKKDRIKIAFNPLSALSDDKDAEIFAVQDQSHLRSKKWIPDIAEYFRIQHSAYEVVKLTDKYCADNSEISKEDFSKILTKLGAVLDRSMGVIELADNLDINIVTDIFIRINSKGTVLSQGDFVMSKIAADERFGGNMLRKAIDYFSHLCLKGAFYEQLKETDLDFVGSEYFQKVAWLKDDLETVYDPKCDDILRVAFMHMYPRARLADLVSLLSGRDFESHEYRDEIVEGTFCNLKKGVLNVINEYNFKQFMLAIHGAGFISKKLINSYMALDFAYALYLRLSVGKIMPLVEIKQFIQKWYVLSVLTGRYSASPETGFNQDLRKIIDVGPKKALSDIEEAILSDNFWNVNLVQKLEYASPSNPVYIVYLASQISNNEYSLFSNHNTVKDLIEIIGDVHHIFPKEYLKQYGYDKNKYNQNANYVYLDSSINKYIGKKSPSEYFTEAFAQCESKECKCGNITDIEKLKENLRMNCIPDNICSMTYENYEDFLLLRRKMMVEKIRKYYYDL